MKGRRRAEDIAPVARGSRGEEAARGLARASGVADVEAELLAGALWEADEVGRGAALEPRLGDEPEGDAVTKRQRRPAPLGRRHRSARYHRCSGDQYQRCAHLRARKYSTTNPTHGGLSCSITACAARA